MKSAIVRLIHTWDTLRKCVWALMNIPKVIRGVRLRWALFVFPQEEREKYVDEINYLNRLEFYKLFGPVFPYPTVRAGIAGSVKILYDNQLLLPYVAHGAKRLYYPSVYMDEQILGQYIWYVDIEGITGKSILAKVPHAYVGDGFNVDKGDVLVDVGSAEALFTLNNIEKVSHAYVFEALPEWYEPLAATFSPWKEKVTVINKFVGATTFNEHVRLLDVLLSESVDSTFFIKMDVEGGERDVIADSRDFLCSHKVKLSCCVYHRDDDAVEISRMLVDMGFSVTFSDGYLIPTMGRMSFPYFRHGVIHAVNFKI